MFIEFCNLLFPTVLPQNESRMQTFKLNFTQMKHLLFFLATLIEASACQLIEPKDTSNSISIEVNGVPYTFKEVFVEETTAYDLNYPDQKEYVVSAYSEAEKQEDRELIAFFFIQMEDSMLLHSFHWVNKLGGFALHREDDYFKKYLQETTTQTGSKVECKLSATLKYSNGTIIELTNGICKFDTTALKYPNE